MKDTLMYKEIFESVDKINQCYEYNKEIIKQLANRIKEFNPDNVIINGRGTSYHSGMYAKYLIELYLGIPVSIASQSIYTIYNKNLKTNKSLVLSISQSGSAKDVTKVVEETRKNGALTVAITNNIDGATAKSSEYNLFCNVGKAEAYAATKTYTETMYLIIQLVHEITGDKDLFIDNSILIETMKTALSKESEIYKLANNFKDTEDIIVLGRGLNHPVAMEFALKLRETINIHTSAYQISEFYHGPLMMTSPKRNIFVIATDSHTYQNAEEILSEVKKMGAKTFIITNNENLLNKADLGLLTKANNDLYSMFQAIICMQLFVSSISDIRGKNPDFMPELEHINTY